MKIAAAAYPIDWHNRWNEYVGKLRVWVRTGAEQGAELLLFPEYAALELASLADEKNARDPQKAMDAVSARIKDVDDLHASLAREFKVHICAATSPLRARDGRATNRARLFAPDGSMGYQDKLMPSVFERGDWGVSGGDGPRVFVTSIGRIGILVGYDAEFPLIARAMAEAGAEVLLVPSSTDTPAGHARVRLGARARALENQCIVAQAVTIGEADWLPAARRSAGIAAIFGPPDAGFADDGIIAAGKAGAPGWTTGEASLDAVARVRVEGSVRTYADWPEQARVLSRPVETIELGAPATGPGQDPAG
jgi:predicted amidohydrolase